MKILLLWLMSRQGNTWMFEEAMILLIWVICISSDLVEPLFPEVRNRKGTESGLISSTHCESVQWFQDRVKPCVWVHSVKMTLKVAQVVMKRDMAIVHTGQELINHCFWKVHQGGVALFTFILSISCSIQRYFSLR